MLKFFKKFFKKKKEDNTETTENVGFYLAFSLVADELVVGMYINPELVDAEVVAKILYDITNGGRQKEIVHGLFSSVGKFENQEEANSFIEEVILKWAQRAKKAKNETESFTSEPIVKADEVFSRFIQAPPEKDA